MLGTLAAMAVIATIEMDERDWSETARADIEFIHQQTRDHHPGPRDRENPDFEATMDDAYRRGMALADEAETQAGYAMALYAYAASYRDGHYGVRVERGIEHYQWPGFITTRVGGQWFAHSRTDETAEIDGWRIESCDGRDLDDWMEERVFAFYGNPALGADWGRRAAQLMVDRGNPFVARPVRCELSNDDTSRSVELDWQPVGIDPWWDIALEVSRPQPAPWGLREVAPGSFWIGAPTFGPRGDDLATMQALIADIQAHASELRSADRIVFDVRGNNGGSSDWGDQMVAAIWGEDYAAYRSPAESAGVDYRISEENIEHVRWIIDLTVDQDMPEAEVYFREVLEGMLAADAAGADFYVERREETDPAPAAENPVDAQVYFLTDGACGSACLDFADRMYALGGVVHIGSETVADSDYMELRTIDFPSGLGSLGLPIKVYRGRPRASGQSYVPEIPYTGTDWSTAALEAWVLSLED